MNEIERAIQEFEDNAYHTSMKPTISEASKSVALRILRAELSRQENALLTQKLELLNGGDFDVIDIPAALAYLESVEEILPHASALIDLIQSLKGTAIELTARAEQAELERDAAVVDMKSIVDAVREEYSDGTCCFACKYDFDTSCDEYGCCPGECPGFESNDCFEWRGLPQEGEGK